LQIPSEGIGEQEEDQDILTSFKEKIAYLKTNGNAEEKGRISVLTAPKIYMNQSAESFNRWQIG
jgi:hypothetical protein